MRLATFVLFLCSVFTTLSAQLSIRVVEIPVSTPLSDTIFVVGNFNNWNPGDVNYQLIKALDGTYTIDLNPNPGNLEFKFTRGDWGRVEGNANGGFRPNRTFSYDGNAQVLELSILSWEGLGNGSSTAAANVSILDESFFIPQLNRNRRIWLYLPPDYQNSNKNYPVLYMQDGQNLFDRNTSFSGEWEIDETLNALFDQGDYGIIVVGIDNGGANRIDEYLPWPHPSYGGGNGPAYIDFIVETLKPYIDENYRTLPEQEYTGIMGSSLGGLISCYGLIEHQEVFGKAGCFSSSFWLYDKPYQQVSDTGKEQDVKMYFIAGQLEDDQIDVPADMYRMQQTLFDAGFSSTEIKAVDHADGTHSEWYWAREFSAAYQWLFGDLSLGNPPEGLSVEYGLSIYPNPGEDYLIIDQENIASSLSLQLYDGNGKLIVEELIREAQQRVRLPNMSAATYFIQVRENKRLIFSEKWVKK